MTSPDSVSSDNSLSNAMSRQTPVIYQEQIQIQPGTTRVLSNPGRIQMQQHVQDPGYLLQRQFELQQQQVQHQQQQQFQHQQQQFVHGGHYIHPNHAIPTYYPIVYPSQQQPHQQQQQFVHGGHYIHHNRAIPTYYNVYPSQQQPHQQVYYVPARQPQAYNLPVQQGNIGESAATISSSRPQNPPNPTTLVQQNAAYTPVRNALPKTEMTAAAYNPQFVQVPTDQYQQQYVTYSQIHHPSQSMAPNSAAPANYAHEYADAAQIYYSQPMAPTMPSQYQTMAAANMMQPEVSAQHPSDGLKKQIRTSQPSRISVDSVTSASEKIQAIIDESQRHDYSHFISLPLAIHPELVSKLMNFQHTILGNDDSCIDENLDTDSNETENTTDDKEVDQSSKENADVAVEIKVDDDSKSVKVNLTGIPFVSYAPKASKPSTSSDLGIDKSIFINPKTFHLTVLMLKLWNTDRVKKATEVLQSISSKVIEALDNRPLSIRLKGLECMKGSLAKAHVLYTPVEEIGNEARLLRACQVIIDAYVEAGLVFENDAKRKLKLHATVMNSKHRKRTNLNMNADSFDARNIFKQYGSEDWGQYLIREAHLSKRFPFDETKYYPCCASIPFPESIQEE